MLQYWVLENLQYHLATMLNKTCSYTQDTCMTCSCTATACRSLACIYSCYYINSVYIVCHLCICTQVTYTAEYLYTQLTCKYFNIVARRYCTHANYPWKVINMFLSEKLMMLLFYMRNSMWYSLLYCMIAAFCQGHLCNSYSNDQTWTLDTHLCRSNLSIHKGITLIAGSNIREGKMIGWRWLLIKLIHFVTMDIHGLLSYEDATACYGLQMPEFHHTQAL